MPDMFSELKRIKADLKNGSSKELTQPVQRQVATVPGLPPVIPLRQSSNLALPSLRNRPVEVLPSSSSHKALRSGPLRAPESSIAQKPISSQSGLVAALGSPSRATSRPFASPPKHSQPAALVLQNPSREGNRSNGSVRSSGAPASPHGLRPSVPAQVAPTARAVATPPKIDSPRPAPSSFKRTEPVPSIFRPLPKGKPTRQGLFRLPEVWLGAGGKTQCVDDDHRGTVDVVIGLDFGTSFTKAAVGFRDKIFPVTWHGVSSCSPDYLLPSEYTQLEDGTVFVGQHPAARPDQICGDLKLPFINPGISSASVGAASSFVSLVLRYVRAWVYRHHAAKIGRAKIRWQLNLGAPSNGLESSPLIRTYRVLAATAWQRSLEVDPKRLAGSPSELWREGVQLKDLIDFQIRPEFVAQMAGYMQSPQRQRGLHALVDVGGGTLDVVTFIVHRVEDEDTFPFLVPQVHPLGTHGLIQNRLMGAEGMVGSGAVDELAPIESALNFARALGVDESRVIGRDTLFQSELRRVIKSVFDITKGRRYRLSDAWRTGVRTFFTGGGSQSDLYREALLTTRVPSVQGLQLMPLPPHKNLDEFSGGAHEYQRISVACGLAQDAFTLGRIVPAREVEDDTAIASTLRANRPDRDELYPK